MKLLAIDTATEALSVALLHDGEVDGRFEVIGRGHAERLLPMVDEMLAAAGWSLASLDAIAFGRGPGAFTGVRIAVSVAQGLAFGAGLPLIPVSDLAALGLQALLQARTEGHAATAALACLDARMAEVYAAVVRRRADGGVDLLSEQLLRPELVSLDVLDGGETAVGAGHGFSAHVSMAPALGSRLVATYPSLLPRAHEIARLAALEFAAGRVVAAEEGQPVYLRDDVATRSTRAPGI
ncbi:MAG: tRNA (adenosine(37)-N6)-threonylcarbamoyltransferase complex dimerization subunit type 1 TsaB [Pseudomonadota bacterium]